MLFVSALVLQTLLVSECLLRRCLMVFMPGRVTAVQRYANAELVGMLLAAALNTATLPFQALVRVFSGMSRYIVPGLFLLLLFMFLLVLSPNSVYMYGLTVQIYNVTVTPFLVVMRVVFVLIDVLWRGGMPIINGVNFFLSQILRRIVVPLSRELVVDIGEMLKLLVLALVALARAFLVWGERLWDCTGGYEPRPRLCGELRNTTLGNTMASDCGAVFVEADSSCYASSSHLQLDLVTPGLFMRAAARVLQNTVATRCTPVALVMNLAIFPFTDYQLYLSMHALVNFLLQGFVLQWVQMARRCAFVQGLPVSILAKTVGCSPDYGTLFDLATTALQSIGLTVDAWLNFAALQLSALLGGRLPTCNGESTDAAGGIQLRLEDVVLDAGRAIEGRTIADIELLAGRGGLPQSETLTKLRVVGLSARMIAVTDGLSVLYRSVYDGTVFAYGAFPFEVDVRAGLAAVPYTMQQVGEADPFGDRSTGLLGCTCRDSKAGIVLHCATAPYIAHVEDDEAAFNATASHRVTFPELSLRGTTCKTVSVRVLPLRWPRARLARAGSHGEGVSAGGYSGYQRPSLSTAGRNWRDFFTGDDDAVDSLREHANVRRTARVSGVVASIYVAPVCGGDGDGAHHLRCGRVEDNCFPYCLGLVRAGARSQNISMHNAKRWAESVVLPDADCGAGRDRGGACDDSNPAGLPLVEVAGALRRARCSSSCAPSAVASSVWPLPATESAGNGTLDRLARHNAVFGAVRMQEQPLVVAGDAMLVRSAERLNVVRLYDVGRASMQIAAERLTSVVNAHAARVEHCNTQDDYQCVANAMLRGSFVWPFSFLQVGGAGAQAALVVLPAASSRFAVHFAVNPELAVYQAWFDFCNGDAAVFAFLVDSSFGRARVWTVQTMRAVDLEQPGEPSEAEVASRVSYMRVPDFFEPASEKQCDVIVGLRIVAVEYLNAENILVTVLAGRPRDYDPLLGDLRGPRHYRYYFLHPQRHTCHEFSEHPQQGFTCWRAESEGMFPDDRLISTNAVESNLCPEQRPLPALGTATVLPVVAMLAALETLLESALALLAAGITQPSNPSAAILKLLTLDLEHITFHSMLDSGGARLFDVDPFLNAMSWMSNFQAGLMIFAVDSFIATTGLAGAGAAGDKTAGKLRTLVVGTARVRQGSPLNMPPFAQVEALFRAPVEQAASQASAAVLTSTEGVGGFTLPGAVRMFARAQMGMVSQAELVLRLGRAMAIRFLEASSVLNSSPLILGRGKWSTKTLESLASVVSSAIVDARNTVESSFFDVMRSQCHGLGVAGGWDGPIVQALFQACMVLPDTLEGCFGAFVVFVSEYPAAACVCKQLQSMSSELSGAELARTCLAHESAAAQHVWVQELLFHTAAGDRNKQCFAAMDGANARLRTAFDKAFRRLYLVGHNAGQAADSALALLTGDSIACDAFDVSPYVLSIVPEPIDYFMHCSDTADCRTRCFEEFRAFEAANASLLTHGQTAPGIEETVTIPVESMLFSLEDVADGRAAPPFRIHDAAELSPSTCAVVCSASPEGARQVYGNRCVAVAGVGRGALPEVAYSPEVAYYCLPIDMMQYVRRWRPQAPPVYAIGQSPDAQEQLLQVLLLSAWAPEALSPAFPSDALLGVLSHANGYGQPVTRLVLMRANMQPRQLLRTWRETDPLETQNTPEFNAEGWMRSLERIEVVPASVEGGTTTISVFGHREYYNPKEPHSHRQRRACLRAAFTLALELEFNPSNIWAECEVARSDDMEDKAVYENHAGGARWETSQSFFSVCVRAAAEPADCVLTLEVPHRRPTSGRAQLRIVHSGDASSDSPRTLDASDSMLDALQVDSNIPTYFDEDGQKHVRVALLASVYYSNTQELQALQARESSTVQLLLLNGRDTGSWLHVLDVKIPPARSPAQVQARLRESLPSEALVSVQMQCSVQNCAACGQTRARERLPLLEELEHTCYAAQVRHAYLPLPSSCPLLHFCLWFPRISRPCFRAVARLPVSGISVSWLAALAFCARASARPGAPACPGAAIYRPGLTLSSCADVRHRPLRRDAGEHAQAVVQHRQRVRRRDPRGARRAAVVLARAHRLRGRRRGGTQRAPCAPRARLRHPLSHLLCTDLAEATP